MTDQTASTGIDPNSVRKVIQVKAPQAVAWRRVHRKDGDVVAADNVQNRQSECRGCCDRAARWGPLVRAR